MKKATLTFYFFCSSLIIFAQTNDSFWISYFKQNPGSIAAVIGLAIFYFIIKPVYRSLIQEEAIKPVAIPIIVDCIVIENPISVLSRAHVESEIVTDLQIGDKFQLDENTAENFFCKIILETGQTGYMIKTCKFERITKP